MRKVLYYLSAGALLLAGLSRWDSAAIGFVSVSQARPSGSLIEVAEGRFDKFNYFDLLKFVAKRQDKVIGLKISVDKAEKDNQYLTSIEGRQLIISSLGRDQGIEILIDDGRFEHGGYVLDGFYLVKSGGVHQGTSSFGLSSIDEAQIRLNGGLKIKTVKIGR